MTEPRRYALVGCPLHTKVWTAMLGKAFEALELPHKVQKSKGTDSSSLGRLLSALRHGDLAGAFVSGPVGFDAVQAADELDPSALRARCANTLVRTEQGRVRASNTTVLGLTDALQALKFHAMTAVIVGAGTSAVAAAAACNQLDVPVIGVTSRSWTSTEVLLESDSAQRMRTLGALTALWPTPVEHQSSSHFSEVMRLQFNDLAASAALIVHATPVGASPATEAEGEDLCQALSWSRIRRDALVCDLVYRPDPSPFLRAARAEGLATVGGLEIGVRQCARAVQMWTGFQPPLAVLESAARQACTEQHR